MVVAGSPSLPLWMIPCGMGVYVMGITLFARDEAGAGKRYQLLFGATCYVRWTCFCRFNAIGQLSK